MLFWRVTFWHFFFFFFPSFHWFIFYPFWVGQKWSCPKGGPGMPFHRVVCTSLAEPGREILEQFSHKVCWAPSPDVSIVLHKDHWRFFCRLKHILPVVRFPFPVKFLIRLLGVCLQLLAPLHQLPVLYVQQYGWLFLIFFSMNLSDSPDSSVFFYPFEKNIWASYTVVFPFHMATFLIWWP